MNYREFRPVVTGVLITMLSLVFWEPAFARLTSRDVEKLRMELEEAGATFTINTDFAAQRHSRGRRFSSYMYPISDSPITQGF